MSTATNNGVRGVIVRWVAVTQASTLVVIILGSLIFSAITKHRISSQVAKDMHNSLLTGEYRNAMVISSLAVKTDFIRIYFKKKSGDLAFSVPIEQEKIAHRTFFDVIAQPIHYAPEGGDSAGTLYFEADPLELLPQAFILWVLITVVSIPLYLSAYRRIERRHRQEMVAQKNEAIAHLSQNLAHDLKNPLIAFDFAARSENWDDFLKIRDQLNRSYATVMSIIAAIGKGESDAAVLRDIEFRPGECISDISQMFRGICARVTYQGPEVVRAFLDKMAVERAIANLVRNAIEAGAKDVTVSVSVDGAQILIEVLDDGPGVPTDVEKHLFSRGMTRGKQGGSGIGLFNVMEITRAHGGTTIYRRLHGKSVFSMILPKAVMCGDQLEVRAHAKFKEAVIRNGNQSDHVLIKMADANRYAAIKNALSSLGIRAVDQMTGRTSPLCAYLDYDCELTGRDLGDARIIYDEGTKSPERAASLIAVIYKDLLRKGDIHGLN